MNFDTHICGFTNGAPDPTILQKWISMLHSSIVISKGLETPVGTQVRVRRVGVRVRNV